MGGIRGIVLKSIVVEDGQDHDKITGDLYIDKVKAGEFINDGWCDEFYIEFLTQEYEDNFNKIMVRYYKRKKIQSTSYEYLIRELLFISKEYKADKNSLLNCSQLSYLWK